MRVYFLYTNVLGCLADATASYLDKVVANKHVRAELEVFNVEVPMVFFGTRGGIVPF